MSLAYGSGTIVVSKLAVAVAAAGAPRNIFTITGYVRIYSMFGWISTAISANATALDMTFDPTDGALVAIAASTTVTSEPIGTMLGLTFVPTDVLTNRGEGWTTAVAYEGIFAPGVLIQGTSGAGATTGAVDWYIEYVPVSTGASIVAA